MLGAFLWQVATRTLRGSLMSAEAGALTCHEHTLGPPKSRCLSQASCYLPSLGWCGGCLTILGRFVGRGKPSSCARSLASIPGLQVLLPPGAHVATSKLRCSCDPMDLQDICGVPLESKAAYKDTQRSAHSKRTRHPSQKDLPKRQQGELPLTVMSQTVALPISGVACNT